MIKDIHDVEECPECASVNITHNDKKQQVTCRDCGMIFEPMAPEREEKFEKAAGIAKKDAWRHYKNFKKAHKMITW